MELITEKFKQTEVGLIPINWELKRLNELSDITRLAGYEYSTLWEEKLNGEIIALRGFNIGKNKIIERDFVNISNKLSMKLVRSRLFKGDVVYPCVGSIGNAVVIEEDDKYHIQQNIAKITPLKKKLNSYFLAHYLMSEFGYREIEKFNGSSSQPNILVGSLRKYSVILPNLEEQTAIATALSDADALISSLEKLIAKKRNIKQGAMQQLLQPKEGWEVKKLGEVAEIYTGKKNNQDKVENGEYPFFVRSQSIERINSYSFEGEAILIPGEGNIGKIFHYINGKFDYHQRVYKISDFKDGYFGKYIYRYISEYFGRHAMENSVKATVDSLRLPTFQVFQIPFPPTMEEQVEISKILSDMDAEINALETKLEKYKKVKLGMMQNLLTGKIRLA